MNRAKAVALLTLLLCLTVVNFEIYQKERILTQGQTVFLKLAPVDPRSLLQGDYMALRFEMADQIAASLETESGGAKQDRWRVLDGYAVVKLDNEKVGEFKRLYDKQPRNADEILMRFRLRNGAIKFATNAFFFQEGHARRYESAEYGKFKVSADGELILASLHDREFRNLATSATGPDSAL